MRKRLAVIALPVLIVAAFVIGALSLAKQPPPPPPQNDCKKAVCASCPEGYVLQSVWPDCCRCVPAP